jgi:putative MATE family efflux protein
MLGFGFSQGLQIMVARRIGEKEFAETGKTVEHGFFALALLGAVLLLLVKIFGDGFLYMLLDSPRISHASNDYISIRIYGIFFAFIHIALRAFYIGIGKTKIITWTTIFMSVANIFLDYILIFGKFGMPVMGIKGAALASVIAEGMSAVFFIIYSYKTLDLRKYKLFFFSAFSPPLFNRIMKVSTPTMLQNFVSLSSWLTFFFFVEKLGEKELAVSNVIRNIYHILLLPIWGFSAAVNSLVSNLVGQNRQSELFGLLLKAVVSSTIMVLGFSLVVLLFPYASIHLITTDPGLVTTARPILYIIAAGATLLSVSFIFFSAISGAGRTLEALIIELSVLAAYLLYTWYFCIVLKADIFYVWTAEISYSLLLGMVSFLYLISGKWKGKIL